MRAVICRDTDEVSNDYQEYLQTRHWKNFKYNYKDTHKNQCIYCLEYTDKLDLHHLNYENLGNEREEDVCLLCWKCHKLLHEALDNKEITRGLKILKNI